MQNKFLTISIPVLAISLLTGCTKAKLDEYNPSGATADAIWSTPEGFVTAVNAAYHWQRNYYGKEDGIFMGESGTDLWFNQSYASYANQLSRYEGLTPAAGNPNRNSWRSFWPGILQCNTGIERIGNAGFTNVAERNRREGELRYLRAFYYWHIVETWGGVMLHKSQADHTQITGKRNSIEDFYNLIIEDLEFAAQHLPNSWGNEYSRATKKSALGLMARAWLSRAWQADGALSNTYFTRARDVAQDVINRKAEFGIDLWDSYDAMWNPANNKRNKEALYVVSNASNNALNYDNNGNRLHLWYLMQYSNKPGMLQSFVYGLDNTRRLMPTLALLDMFDEEKDARYYASFREAYITNRAYTWTANDVNAWRKDPSLIGRSFTIGTDTAFWVTKRQVPNKATLPYAIVDRDSTYITAEGNRIRVSGAANFVALKKFHDPDRVAINSGPGFKDVIVIRLAEMYMIAAEAEHKLGNNTAAANHINVLRTRAAVKAPVNYTSQMQVVPGDITIDFILDEKAREFAGEMVRWFDLKRTGKLVERINRLNPDITAVRDYHRLRPVPQEEIDALLNGQEFGQNPGYE